MRATSATSGTIDFHIDEVQTKLLRASSTLEFSRTFCRASVQPRTLKRDEHGARFFLHLEMRRSACVHGRRRAVTAKAGQHSRKSYERRVLHAVRTLRPTEALTR